MSRQIAIVAPSPKPLQLGGAEKFYNGFLRALNREPGCQAELLKHPVGERSLPDLLAGYLYYHQLDLDHFDLVISCKYPAWMIGHRRHLLYMLHPLRGLYDHYHMSGLPENVGNPQPAVKEILDLARIAKPAAQDIEEMFRICQSALAAGGIPEQLLAIPSPLARAVILFFDRYALDPARIGGFFTLSRTVAGRHGYFPPGAAVHVLHPPADMTPSAPREGEYIFTASRLNPVKRVSLIIEAMRYVSEPVRLKIAGTGPDFERLQILARGDERIEFLGYVAEPDLPQLYAGALFVPFVPLEEDYGLIAAEAMQSGKPVITARDSGGVTELVEHGINGLCVEPDARALGMAMQRLASDPVLRAQMGKAALGTGQALTWGGFAREFLHLADKAQAARKIAGRKKIVVLAHYAPDEHGTGGGRRLFHVCRELAGSFEVLVLSVDRVGRERVEECELAPHVRLLLCPWPREGISRSIRREPGPSIDDWAIMGACGGDPELLALAKAALTGADAIVLEHPYLFPLCRDCGLPKIYDAHNVEAELKSQMPGLSEVAKDIEAVERECCHAACRIICCSAEDGAALRRRYGIAGEIIHIAPNGVQVDAPAFRDHAQRRVLRGLLPYPDAKLALFIGSGHWPNVQAVSALAGIAAALPDVQFIIAGSVCGEVAGMTFPENVHFAGEVSENVKNVLLHAADIALNPMSCGSGTNLKLVEYLACGLETVSTPVGARGLEIRAGLHIAELADFAGVIAEVIASPATAGELRAAGRQTADRYAWPRTLAGLCPLVAEACHGGRQGNRIAAT